MCGDADCMCYDGEVYQRLAESEARVKTLEARLEISPDHGWDGIACRDETIRLLTVERDALKLALLHVSKLSKKQLDLIADRATGSYLDKLPVVRAMMQHKKIADDALAAITKEGETKHD